METLTGYRYKYTGFAPLHFVGDVLWGDPGSGPHKLLVVKAPFPQGLLLLLPLLPPPQQMRSVLWLLTLRQLAAEAQPPTDCPACTNRTGFDGYWCTPTSAAPFCSKDPAACGPSAIPYPSYCPLSNASTCAACTAVSPLARWCTNGALGSYCMASSGSTYCPALGTRFCTFSCPNVCDSQSALNRIQGICWQCPSGSVCDNPVTHTCKKTLDVGGISGGAAVVVL